MPYDRPAKLDQCYLFCGRLHQGLGLQRRRHGSRGDQDARGHRRPGLFRGQPRAVQPSRARWRAW
eukprot:6653709-Alexandrium_andersonii.AAC.1